MASNVYEMPKYKAENAYDEFQSGVQKDTHISLGW